ncbi:MAG TPA: PAS domain-containing protein [Chlorobaculum sp.]|nr:PAS domain-containing protein [Chlorobaculum sp.]
MDSYKTEPLTGTDYPELESENASLRQQLALLVRRASISEQAQQSLELALDATRAGYWNWNIATGEIDINRQWAEIIGYEYEKLLPLTMDFWMELCHPDDLKLSKLLIEEHLSGRTPFYELELRVRHRNGNWIWVLDRGKICQFDEKGNPLRLIGSRHDITTRKMSEEALRNSAVHERIAQEFKSLIENIPGAVYRINGSGKTIMLSKPPDFLTGLEGKDYEIACFETLSMVHPNDRDAVADSYRSLKESKKSQTLIYRIVTGDNTFRWIEDRKTSTFSGDGTFTGIDGILFDITDRIAAQEEKHKLESQLRKSQRLETIGTLAGGIAHDFNNILTPILGYSEMGVVSLPSDNPLHEYFTEIMQAAERAQNLVSQILTFSRAQENTPSATNVQSIISEALKLLRPSIPSTITIEQHIESSSRNTLADPSQIQQVIVNLCTNAFHAMEETGGTLSIDLREIEVEKDKPAGLLKLPQGIYLQLSITDTGSGMDEATVERIFEPFFTTKSVEKGTGLGLSVVHGIITACNGDISVESVLGQGTTLRVYLPVIAEKASIEPDSNNSNNISGSVLFVDDEPAAVQIMILMMKKLGHTIHAESSPVQALKLYRENPGRFDLVITDLTMPEMTGIQLAGELHKTTPELPVILMTGYGKIIDQATSFSHYGISRLLKKPVKLVQLSAAVNEVLSATIQNKPS